MTAPEKIYMCTYQAESRNCLKTCDIKKWLPSDIPYVREDLTGWRPIETAPKDGREIDVFSLDLDDRYTDVSWNKDRDGWADYTGLDIINASHWRPIPEKPRAES
jgi:hypothetical protein